MKQKTGLSFELFPPKTDAGMQKLRAVMQQLYTLQPDYISCTYGAGGNAVGKNLELLDQIVLDGKCTPVTHFTCVGHTEATAREQLERYLEHGICHILALRGDRPAEYDSVGDDFHYATDLVKFIRREFGDRFKIAVAGSPEGHIDCISLDSDISYLKMKQDLGAERIMTQLCFDLDQFARWMDKIRAAGVTMKVDVGIMPVLDQAAIINMALSRNACVMPRDLSKLISKHWIFPNPFAPDDPKMQEKKDDFKKAGIDYTIGQIERLKTMGVNGFHLYALNKFEDAAYIARASGLVNAEPICYIP